MTEEELHQAALDYVKERNLTPWATGDWLEGRRWKKLLRDLEKVLAIKKGEDGRYRLGVAWYQVLGILEMV